MSLTNLTYGSVCSGIEAATVAWHQLGLVPAWFSEIEPFPCAVLAHHYLQVPNLGDMTKIRERVEAGEVVAPDLLVGGTPCQAFSVAGLRNSLDDDRGQLSLEFVRLANAIDSTRLVCGHEPTIILWENVPGVLNTKDNAFGCFLGALAGSGCELQPPGQRWHNAGCIFGPQRQVAWRTLDAQFFGLAQRRKRVFIIASAMDGFNPAEILFESNSLCRNTETSSDKKQDITPTITHSAGPSRGAGTDLSLLTTFKESSFAQFRATDVGATPKKRGGVCEGESEKLIVGSLDTECGFQKATLQSVNAGHLVIHGTQDPSVNTDLAHCLGRNRGQENVIYAIKGTAIDRQPLHGGNGLGIEKDQCPTLTKMDRHAVFQQNTRDEVRFIQGNGQVAGALAAQAGVKQQNYLFNTKNKVRRFMPLECERLQGFPDNYTQIPYRKKPVDECPDSPRYAALGNSMAVPVMRWLGERIKQHLETRKMK